MRKNVYKLGMGLLLLGALTLLGCKKHQHSYGPWETTREATCIDKGRQERLCQCGEKEVRTTDRLEHSYESASGTAGSCVAGGELQYTCTVCNHSYTEPAQQKTYTATQIYEMYKNSVGEIVVYDKRGDALGLGSCFVYDTGNKLITNYHVIEGAYTAEVTFAEKTYRVEKVLACDPEIDLAILQLEKGGLTPVTLCDRQHEVGAVVYALGNSKGLTSTFSDGMITTASREVDGVNYVQHDAPISGGNSGGPLINAYGEVIGVNTWTYVDSQNLNFAIHLSELENLDLGNPMTMADFYESQGNAFQTLKNYLLEEGEYDEGTYDLFLGERNGSDGDYFFWWASYDPEDECIDLYYSYDSEHTVVLTLDSDLSGEYQWIYLDEYDNVMSGSIWANSYEAMDTLPYDYDDITNSDLKNSVLTMATLLMGELVHALDTDLAAIGISLEDLGFLRA